MCFNELVSFWLAESSSRSGYADVYVLHVQARIETSVSMQAWMKVKMPRRWKLQAYQKEQRAVTKLVTSLLGGLNPTDTIVVWGNGASVQPLKATRLHRTRNCSLTWPSTYRSSLAPNIGLQLRAHAIMEQSSPFQTNGVRVVVVTLLSRARPAAPC